MTVHPREKGDLQAFVNEEFPGYLVHYLLYLLLILWTPLEETGKAGFKNYPAYSSLQTDDPSSSTTVMESPPMLLGEIDFVLPLPSVLSMMDI